MGVTYEYNDISTLYSGSDRLENESTSRSTQSLLLEINYGISDRLSASGTFTYVNKARTTGLQSMRSPTTVTTQGIGDGLFTLRYVVFQQTLWNPYHLAVGGGAKIPFGTTSHTENGLALNADMQPGTGAWDGVLWSYAAASFLPHTTLNLFWFNTYRRTSSSNRFAQDDQYMFGNELVSTLGVTDRLIGNLSYVAQVRYRSTSSDRRNDRPMPNTGGTWVSVIPALSFSVSDQVSVRFSGRFPVFQHLNGTQPTTSQAVRLSLFLNLNSSDEEFVYGNPR